MCEICLLKAWIVIRSVFFVRHRMCGDCWMDCLKLLPRGMR
jgi:hypothetical protein